MNLLKTNHEIKQKNQSLKKVITSILFLLLFTSAFSQKSRIDSMLINIDKTNFTNILYERTTPWSRIDVFNDSINISTKKCFEQALHELYKASNEQIAFDYFMTEIFQNNYPKIKTVYFLGKVEEETKLNTLIL